MEDEVIKCFGVTTSCGMRPYQAFLRVRHRLRGGPRPFLKWRAGRHSFFPFLVVIICCGAYHFLFTIICMAVLVVFHTRTQQYSTRVAVYMYISYRSRYYHYYTRMYIYSLLVYTLFQLFFFVVDSPPLYPHMIIFLFSSSLLRQKNRTKKKKKTILFFYDIII